MNQFLVFVLMFFSYMNQNEDFLFPCKTYFFPFFVQFYRPHQNFSNACHSHSSFFSHPVLITMMFFETRCWIFTPYFTNFWYFLYTTQYQRVILIFYFYFLAPSESSSTAYLDLNRFRDSYFFLFLLNYNIFTFLKKLFFILI